MRVIVYQASDTSALSKNFTRKDFKCPCGCSRQMVDSELVEKLQAIRDKLGKAIKVTSGYRCLSHNAAVGGSSGSNEIRSAPSPAAVIAWVKLVRMVSISC